MRRTWVLLAALTGLLGLSVAKAGLLVSEKEVRREARVQWLEMKNQLPLEPDKRVQRYVQCVADDLIDVVNDEKSSKKNPFDWEVVVFDDDKINASSDPDGKIAVFSGLLRVADTPDALAAVLGHEISHATHGHVMARAKRGVRTDMLVLLGSAATGLSPGLLDQGAAVGLTLPYAREQETEADLAGLQLMAKAGFDPRAAVTLWKNMENANKGGSPPEFLSDHPDDDQRIDNIIKALAPALVTYNKARDAGKRPNCQIR
jgi:predicted Zn-dependent protease